LRWRKAPQLARDVLRVVLRVEGSSDVFGEGCQLGLGSAAGQGVREGGNHRQLGDVGLAGRDRQLRSGLQRITVSAASARDEAGSLVMASVTAPCRRASASTSTTSGEAPDWLMPMTSARLTSGCARYTDWTDGTASPVASPLRIPNTYCA
jgi:hypothetical protein